MMRSILPLLSLLAAASIAGCQPGPRTPYPPYFAYSPYPPYVFPPGYLPPPPPGPPQPGPAASRALDLPAQPGPFGLLAPFRLGQPAEEVKAASPGLLESGGQEQDGTVYEVEIEDKRVAFMRISFDHDRTADLTARWGDPVKDGTRSAWLVPDAGLRVVLDSAEWAIRIVPYVPLARLLAGEGGKLKGSVADVLSMDRKAFEARFPAAEQRAVGKRVDLDVVLPPVEGTLRETELTATFSPSGALLAVELSVGTSASKAVAAVLETVHGAPRELPLCAAAKKPCVIAAGVYQADPVLRYGKSTFEITTWPHDWGILTVRWSRAPTRTDFFTTFTPPDRVREPE